jgi:hypothetical protein
MFTCYYISKGFVSYFNVLSFLHILAKRQEVYLDILYLGERHLISQ